MEDVNVRERRGCGWRGRRRWLRQRVARAGRLHGERKRHPRVNIAIEHYVARVVVWNRDGDGAAGPGQPTSCARDPRWCHTERGADAEGVRRGDPAGREGVGHARGQRRRQARAVCVVRAGVVTARDAEACGRLGQAPAASRRDELGLGNRRVQRPVSLDAKGRDGRRRGWRWRGRRRRGRWGRGWRQRRWRCGGNQLKQRSRSIWLGNWIRPYRNSRCRKNYLGGNQWYN